MDESKKKICGEAVREIIKIFADKGLNHKEAQNALMVVGGHLRNVADRAKVEDTSAEISTNFIDYHF